MIHIQINENPLLGEDNWTKFAELSGQIKNQINNELIRYGLINFKGSISCDIPFPGQLYNLYVQMDTEYELIEVVNKLRNSNTLIHILHKGQWVVPYSYKVETKVWLA